MFKKATVVILATNQKVNNQIVKSINYDNLLALYKTGDDKYELSSFNGAANSGIFLWTKRSAALKHDTDYAMNEAAFTGTIPRTTLSARSWYCLDRPSSALSRQYINGVLLNFNSKTSAAPTNFDVYEFGAAVPPSSFAILPSWAEDY